MPRALPRFMGIEPHREAHRIPHRLSRRIRCLHCHIFLTLLVFAADFYFLSPAARAQEAQPVPAAQSPAASPSAAAGSQNPKRIAGILPNFSTADEYAPYTPLTSSEKFKLSVRQMFDTSAFAGSALSAAISQAADSEPHYGQGWGAYGKRVAAAQGDKITSSLFTTAVLASLLKQDPRYFRRGRGRLGNRTLYAISRTLVARADSGRNTFNTSLVVGDLISGGISNAYYPRRDRDIAGTFESWGLDLVYHSAHNMLREFYPDISRKIFRRHTPPTPAPSAGTTP